MSVLQAATDCWRQAAKAEKHAAQITDQHLKAVYLLAISSPRFQKRVFHWLAGPCERTKSATAKTLSCQSLRKFNFHTFATIRLRFYPG